MHEVEPKERFQSIITYPGFLKVNPFKNVKSFLSQGPPVGGTTCFKWTK
jgi:hypothetical protein